MNGRRPGFALLMVLMTLGVLAALCAASLLWLRPANLSLDAHLAALRARELADGVVQEALAGLDAGRTPAPFERTNAAGEFTALEPKAMHVTASAPVPAQPAARVSRFLRVTLAKAPERWTVRSYVIEENPPPP